MFRSSDGKVNKCKSLCSHSCPSVLLCLGNAYVLEKDSRLFCPSRLLFSQHMAEEGAVFAEFVLLFLSAVSRRGIRTPLHLFNNCMDP